MRRFVALKRAPVDLTLRAMSQTVVSSEAPSMGASFARPGLRTLGLLHLGLVVLALVVGSVYASLLRALPHGAADTLLSMLRAHGVVMVFLCVVPAIPSTLGYLLLPRLVGVDRLPLMGLHRAGWWTHLLGFVLILVAVATRGTASGFLLYDATHASVPASVLWLLAALTVLALSSALVAMGLITTMHRGAGFSRRALRDLPPLGSALYAVALTQLGLAPLLMIVMVLLAADRLLGIGLFNAAIGGDALLFTELAWFYLHPALMGSFVAAVGVVEQVIADHTGLSPRPRTGPTLFALCAVSVLGAGQHLYTAGTGTHSVLYASLAAIAFYLPMLVIVGSWLGALQHGGPRLTAAVVYVFGFIALCAVGLPAGLLLALPSSGSYLSSTVFATGQLHYLTVGGTLFGLLAGLHHAFPQVFSKSYDERAACLAAGGLFVGTQLAFFPMLLMGARGVPRPMPLELSHGVWHIVSSVGIGLTLVSLLAITAVLLRALLPKDAESALSSHA